MDARGIAGGVNAHLPLLHDGGLAGMNELDGVLQGYDVLAEPGVDVLHDGGEGGGLAGSGFPRDQNQALGKRCDLLQGGFRAWWANVIPRRCG